MKLTKVNCSICGTEMECPESMLDVAAHICSDCIERVPDPRLQAFGRDVKERLKQLEEEFEREQGG